MALPCTIKIARLKRGPNQQNAGTPGPRGRQHATRGLCPALPLPRLLGLRVILSPATRVARVGTDRRQGRLRPGDYTWRDAGVVRPGVLSD